MTEDRYNLVRTVQRLLTAYSPIIGGSFSGKWYPLWEAEVIEVFHRAGAANNTARILLPDLRWHQTYPGLYEGAKIRILTGQPVRPDGSPLYDDQQRTILFEGFMTRFITGFNGGNEKGGAWEKVEIECMDYRWLHQATSPVYGQWARGADDYNGSDPIAERATFMSGRRCVFNAGSRANRDGTDLNLVNHPDRPGADTSMPIFCDAQTSDASWWSGRRMVEYILSPLHNRIWEIDPLYDPSQVAGLEHEDFDAVPGAVNIEGLDPFAAIMRVIRPMGWNLREYYTEAGPVWELYKIGTAVEYVRDSNNRSILHVLHAPAAGETIAEAIAMGAKMITAGKIEEDIRPVINSPLGLGAVHAFEVTVELVPGWDNNDIVVDDADDYVDVYKTESDLQKESAPNDFDFYKYHHIKGDSFRREVGRKWVLNETGKYTPEPFNRGAPFDWASVIPDQYARDDAGALFGRFARQFKPCLTFDETDVNSVGNIVEISLDAGASWQRFDGSVLNLSRECGIYIEQPNLSEILDEQTGTISGGAMDKIELNYWTALCDDHEEGRGESSRRTRVRITATVEMDQRMVYASPTTPGSGSPFSQRKIYDYSGRYTLTQRTDSSQFSTSGLPAWNTDETDKLRLDLDLIRAANEDMSINGVLVLDRLWLGEGAGQVEFMVGDGIERISGREYPMGGTLDRQRRFTEIVEITYYGSQQAQRIVTRDVRLANLEM